MANEVLEDLNNDGSDNNQEEYRAVCDSCGHKSSWTTDKSIANEWKETHDKGGPDPGLGKRGAQCREGGIARVEAKSRTHDCQFDPGEIGGPIYADTSQTSGGETGDASQESSNASIGDSDG